MRRVKSARRLEPNVDVQPRGRDEARGETLRPSSTASLLGLNKPRSLLKDCDPAWDH
jgi:hypothetical protein